MNVSEIIGNYMIDGELNLTSKNIYGIVMDIIKLNKDVDVIDACLMIIEELDISETEFMKNISNDFKQIIINNAVQTNRVRKKVMGDDALVF